MEIKEEHKPKYLLKRSQLQIGVNDVETSSAERSLCALMEFKETNLTHQDCPALWSFFWGGGVSCVVSCEDSQSLCRPLTFTLRKELNKGIKI